MLRYKSLRPSLSFPLSHFLRFLKSHYAYVLFNAFYIAKFYNNTNIPVIFRHSIRRMRRSKHYIHALHTSKGICSICCATSFFSFSIFLNKKGSALPQ